LQHCHPTEESPSTSSSNENPRKKPKLQTTISTVTSGFHSTQLETFQNTNKINSFNSSTNFNYDFSHNIAKAHLPLPIDRRSFNPQNSNLLQNNFQIPANFSKMPSLKTLKNNASQSNLSIF
ncbi:10830_t:CDS:1, partial [Ambispora leptoticha]